MSDKPRSNWLWTVAGFLAVGALLAMVRVL